MTLPTNVDFSTRELSASELEAVSAGFSITHGPNPPRGGHGGFHGGFHHGGFHHGGFNHGGFDHGGFHHGGGFHHEPPHHHF